MDEPEVKPASRTVIGGRHGSPTVTIALPFSAVSNVDTELRDAVADLAALVVRLTDLTDATSDGEREAVRIAAGELADRLRHKA